MAHKHPTRRSLRALAFGLALSVVLLPFAGQVPARSQPASMAAAGPSENIHSILLFPIGNGTGNPAADKVGPLLDDAIKMKMSDVGKFTVTRFSRLNPSVQVALGDKDLSDDDVATPFPDDSGSKARAQKIAGRVGTDAYFLGSVVGYTVDDSTRKVTISVTGNLYRTADGTSAKSFGLSATAVPSGPNDLTADVVQSAVNNAAGQIAADINAVPVAPRSTVVSSSQHKAVSGGAVAAILVVVAGALVAAASHHGSSSNSSSTSTGGGTGGGGGGPPPPPL